MKAMPGGASGSSENDRPEILSGSKGVLRWIEVLGNKLPHPFWIFLWICIFIVI
jgi:aminobenzoyl-glutamate transport protein